MTAGSGLGGVSGTAVAATAAGGILLWSGIKGASVTGSLRSLVSGKAPSGTETTPLTAVTAASTGLNSPGAAAVGTSYAGGASATAYKAYAATLLALHGWPGQWNSFSNLVMAESGWNPQALNPSGAWGIAQALGHGTAATDAGNGHNQYGNFGTSDAVCRAANGGNGEAQIQWMMNYIAQKFGSPDAAWQFHLANNSY